MLAEDSRSVKSALILWSARISAVGFVILILGGNAWLVFGLFGTATPEWLKLSAILGVGSVILGALGIGVDLLRRVVLRCNVSKL
jgi:lipopolysaccharide export LptBFGC system permease protein LptF